MLRADTGWGFYHDPLGRLDTITGTPGGDYRFQYADGEISTELGTGALADPAALCVRARRG